MTTERANQIVDRVATLLTNPCPIADQFYPLSMTGARSREELAHAVFIVVAQAFRAVSWSPEKMAEFDKFSQSAGSGLWHLLYLQPCLPDGELEVISKLDPNSREAIKESIRLTQYAQNDGMMKLETMESFVSYLRTLEASSDGYWPKVFQRLGLAHVRASAHPARDAFLRLALVLVWYGVVACVGLLAMGLLAVFAFSIGNRVAATLGSSFKVVGLIIGFAVMIAVGGGVGAAIGIAYGTFDRRWPKNPVARLIKWVKAGECHE